MAPYNKTTWVDGGEPAITADKLNNLEKQYDEALAWVKSFGLGTAAKDLASGSDLNTLNATGFYVGSNLLNAPNTFSFFIFHIESSFGKRQIAYKLSTDETYTRIQTGGTWSAWQKIITDTGGTFNGPVDMNGNDLNNVNFLMIGNENSRPDNLRYKIVRSGSTGDFEIRLYDNDGTTLLRTLFSMNADGLISNPHGPVHLEATKASQSFTAGNSTIITGFTEQEDRRYNFNHTTGQYVATVSGPHLFQLEANTTFPIPSTGAIHLEKNASGVSFKPLVFTGYGNHLQVSKAFYLEKGDAIRLMITGNSSGTISDIDYHVTKI
jgi:hypothetical protein